MPKPKKPKPEKPESEKSEPNRIEFTKPALDKLRREKPDSQYTVWDTHCKGLCVLVSPGPAHAEEATVTFRVVYYLKQEPGRPKYKALGRYTSKKKEIEDARLAAAAIQKNAKDGIDPKRPDLEGEAFEEVVERFIEQYAKENRTWPETRAVFERYVLPEWRHWRIGDINRIHVMALLHKIKAGDIRQEVKRSDGGLRRTGRKIGTASNAVATLAQLSKFFNWYTLSYAPADYASPIVRGMREALKLKLVKRERFLSDAELRAMWSVLDDRHPFDAAVKCMVLTAQRVEKVEHMRRGDIKDRLRLEGYLREDGTWVPDKYIENVWDPTRDDDPDNKAVSVVPLSETAREVIDAVPVVDAEKAEDLVFSLNGRKPINGRSNFKKRLDKRMLAALREAAEAAGEDPDAVVLKPWQLRDLRRTARTLLPRAGVRSDIGERCLAHKRQGVEGVYDRHGYVIEKREAFDKLARLIDRITNPPEGDNVVDIKDHHAVPA